MTAERYTDDDEKVVLKILRTENNNRKRPDAEDRYTDNNEVKFSCIDPEVERVVHHFKRINEVYD